MSGREGKNSAVQAAGLLPTASHMQRPGREFPSPAIEAGLPLPKAPRLSSDRQGHLIAQDCDPAMNIFWLLLRFF